MKKKKIKKFKIDSIEKALLWFCITGDRKALEGFSEEEIKKLYVKLGEGFKHD